MSGTSDIPLDPDLPPPISPVRKGFAVKHGGWTKKPVCPACLLDRHETKREDSVTFQNIVDAALAEAMADASITVSEHAWDRLGGAFGQCFMRRLRQFAKRKTARELAVKMGLDNR
jgi:hypothetical protein